MSYSYKIISGLLFSVLFSSITLADMPKVTIQKNVLLTGGEQNQHFVLQSQDNQRQYLIQVFEPNAIPPAQGFPVIYMLDGNASFPYASIMAQAMVSRSERSTSVPPIIVAIGYAGDKSINVEARTYDYTPPISGTFLPQPGRPAPAYPQGGAEIFFQFIEQQLKPVIAQNYTINQQKQTLFGHSYGGLFTLYTYLNHPQAFQNYMAASPSIWWNNEMLLKQAQEHPLKLTQPTQLWLSVGTLESADKTSKTPTVIPISATDIEKFAKSQQSTKNLTVKTFHFTDASHFEAMFPAINQVMKQIQQ